MVERPKGEAELYAQLARDKDRERPTDQISLAALREYHTQVAVTTDRHRGTEFRQIRMLRQQLLDAGFHRDDVDKYGPLEKRYVEWIELDHSWKGPPGVAVSLDERGLVVQIGDEDIEVDPEVMRSLQMGLNQWFIDRPEIGHPEDRICRICLFDLVEVTDEGWCSGADDGTSPHEWISRAELSKR